MKTCVCVRIKHTQRHTHLYHRADHPHVRGEKVTGLLLPKPSVGSSPRTWGEVETHSKADSVIWIIPTHVGRRGPSRSPRQASPDHPHARGEKSLPPSWRSRWSGSSPRTWGEDARLAVRRGGLRIIPTHVGRRHPNTRKIGGSADHPHARGEKERLKGKRLTPRGSSPRTWGEEDAPLRGCLWNRIIPTHVGRSWSSIRGPVCSTDHPHARGEKSSISSPDPGLPGSSPRTWGEALAAFQSLLVSRIIPTHVGRSFNASSLSTHLPDHPHARGEKGSFIRCAINGCGSSPRTWGEGWQDRKSVV